MRNLLLLCLLAGHSAVSQVGSLPQAPARDARPTQQTGTGSIQGRVTASDTGAPLRRATVMLGGQRPRAVYTDDEGRYAFARLPAGTYTISANAGPHRAGYQHSSYGAAPMIGSMGARGKPIDLADGQKLENIDVALSRTALIVGRVSDAGGHPVARVQVRALILRSGAEPMVTGTTSTNDLGEYRLFDLQPGEYVIMAAPGPNMGGPEFEGEPIGLASSFAPGVAAIAEATRMRLRPGAEVTADIRVVETRVYTVSGAVLTSSGEPARGGSISVASRDSALNSSFGTSLSSTGTFTLRNVPPGAYELMARPQGPMPPPGAGLGPMSASAAEFGSVQLDLVADLENVLIATTTGAVVRGEAVFDEPLPPGGRFTIAPSATQTRNFGNPPSVEITGSQFTLKGLFGPMLLRANASGGPQAWALKAVLLRGKDITDEPTTFASSDSGHLQVVFTARAPALEGSVMLEDGRPALDAMIVVFGHDAKTWKPRSSFSRVMPVGKDGKFVLRGLREGRYYAAAVPPEVMAGFAQVTPEFLETLSAVATAITLNEGETRTLDLRLLKFERP